MFDDYGNVVWTTPGFPKDWDWLDAGHRSRVRRMVMDCLRGHLGNMTQAARNGGKHLRMFCEPVGRYCMLSVRHAPPVSLTNREVAVLNLLCEGLSGQQIGERLGISARTVETYRVRITEKTGARTIVEKLRWAIRHGIVSA